MAKIPNDADTAAALSELIQTFKAYGAVESIMRLRVLSEISAALNTDSLLDLAAMVAGPKPARAREADRRPGERPSFQALRI